MAASVPRRKCRLTASHRVPCGRYAALFPDLPDEQAHLAFSRACRDAMIARFERVDPDCRGRRDHQPSTSRSPSPRRWRTCARPAPATSSGGSTRPAAGDVDTYYIGRRHIEDDAHDPVVVDWRAPIAAPFYRATHADPFGLAHRRRFTMDDGELTAYLDERLDDPDDDAAGSGIPDPGAGRDRRGRAPGRCARSSPRSRPSRTR